METNIWIAAVFFVLWQLFRHRLPHSKRRPRSFKSPRILRDTTSHIELNLSVSKGLSKKEIWKIRPEDVFKKEYVSFTRIKTFKTCPRMFELIYLYRFEDKSGRAAQVGTLVHKIVHLYTLHHKGRLSDQIRNSNAVDELLIFYDEAVSATNLTYRIPKSELRPYLTNFVVLNRKNKFQVQVAEHECDSMIGDYKLKCIIDRIDAGHRIIDYKTGNPRYAVNYQLNVYAYALCKGVWNQYQVAFQFLKTGKIRVWNYEVQLHYAIEKWLLQGIQEIENTKVFRRNKSRLCDYCGVSEHCYRVL